MAGSNPHKYTAIKPVAQFVLPRFIDFTQIKLLVNWNILYPARRTLPPRPAIMKKKSVTIYDIAEHLSLSPSTVSRALKGDTKIAVRTRGRIAKAADELNYVPNTVAAGLRGGNTRTIGVIVPRIGRQFFANAISGIERVARERNYRVIITQSKEQQELEREGVAALLGARIDGIIASLSLETTEYDHFTKANRRNVPIVFFDRVTDQVPAHRVVIDDRLASRRAVEHLLEQGARRIAHLGGPESINIYQERHQGYADALAAAGIDYDEQLVFRAHLREEDAAAAVADFSDADFPDAVFCASDFSATGVLEHCRERGLAVPERVKIVGFANEPFTRYLTPALTSVDQRSEELGATAAQLLMDRIEGVAEAQQPQEVNLTAELIIRASSLSNPTAVAVQ